MTVIHMGKVLGIEDLFKFDRFLQNTQGELLTQIERGSGQTIPRRATLRQFSRFYRSLGKFACDEIDKLSARRFLFKLLEGQVSLTQKPLGYSTVEWEVAVLGLLADVSEFRLELWGALLRCLTVDNLEEALRLLKRLRFFTETPEGEEFLKKALAGEAFEGSVPPEVSLLLKEYYTENIKPYEPHIAFLEAEIAKRGR